jgi:death on curing protein
MNAVLMAGGFSERQQTPYDPVWLTVAEVIALHDMQLRRFGGPSGIRNHGALESALGRPLNKWQYEGANIAEMAAAYAFGLARNHPFVDGNKRTAFVAMMLFLRKNGVRFTPPQAEATVIILALAAAEVNETGLIRWIRDRWPKA